MIRHRSLILSLLVALVLSAPGIDFTIVAAYREELFEDTIRPVLATRCVSCHGAERQRGGVRLDSRTEIDAERLTRLVQGESDAPAVCDLKPLEVRSFSKWIDAGLPWPKDTGSVFRQDEASDHWAFQPVVEPDVPVSSSSEWIRTPVDAFVLKKLQQAGLPPSHEADRRTLIRRLSYSVTGLPPSPQAVEDFVNNSDARACERLVESLLSSPQYGEHWARHWLDVARYSDTKGYIYAREERFWPHAWTYRDWVVDALNSDLPYDRFLLLQLAADQLVDEPTDRDLAAMGFLTLGRRFLGVQRDIIDDRIDVVTRGMLGLTVGCARCHDHMYDPIPTEDYYSLYGVFESSQERLTPIGDVRPGGEDFQAELAKRRQTLDTTLSKLREESSERARERIADYLFAQTELEKYPADGFDQVFQKTDLLPAFVHRWSEYLRVAREAEDPMFVPWHAFVKLPEENFAAAAAEVTFAPGSVHPRIAVEFRTPPESMREVADRYGRVFREIDERWQKLIGGVTEDTPPNALPDPDLETLRQVLYGAGAPAEVPDLPIVHAEAFYDSASVTQLWKLEGELARWIIRANVDVPHAIIMEDRTTPLNPRVFLRGNPLNRGDTVPRQFPAALSVDVRKPFENGSGRLEMARAIVDPANPLTARVIVNRVWGHHFGHGLVTTPSDFGVRATSPSHPELLDWLASQFVAEGWSLKKLHRWILLSSTFRQSSQGPNDAAARDRALTVDPSNRLLWRMNPQRLSWEQFRDSMLAASDDLDLKRGGRPVKMLSAPFSRRRSLYGLVDRQFVPALLRTFDFANPDLHIPRRAETTVPQQALFFMNHPLTLDRARALAAFSQEKTSSPEDRIRVLFQQSLQREPSPLEIRESLAFVEAGANQPVDKPPVTVADWQYGYGEVDEQAWRVTGFKKLPHFTGTAWQGGPQWPDRQLGWIQLTADGGHPGNDRQHAAVRRWTAPRDMRISIASRLTHEPAPGDGIRAFIVSSQAGTLATTTIHQKSVELNVVKFEVEQGETIDFVVDIGKVLNSDQYLWYAKLFETSRDNKPMTWNSQTDFPRDRQSQLTAWEQLAQTLLCSNEFLFLD